MQTSAWYISLLFMTLLVIVFIFVFFKSSQRTDYEPIQKKGYRIRRYYLAILIFILLYAAVTTLKNLPYDQPVSAAGGTPIVIQVNAIQFSWDMSAKQVKVGQPVEFDVTSADVNHDFGIYDENMKVLTQVQAMPGYTNKLYYTFTKPGIYKILCLEYCGLAHHYMVTDFEAIS